MSHLPALGMSQRLGDATPVRVTVHYRPPLTGGRRYSRSFSDAAALFEETPRPAASKPVRRVRFDLPPATSRAVPSNRPVQVSGVQSWLRSRAAAAVVEVSSNRVANITPSSHETARYRRGTLPPPQGAAPTQLLVTAAREANEELFCEQAATMDEDINCTDSSGRTALSHIAAHGSLPMLEALLQHPNVDVNKADSEGNTPLHFAAQAGHVEVLNYLLSRRPDIEVDARNNLGFTPLMKAALQGRTKCAKLLLFAGASPTLRDTGRGYRAEQWARFCGRYVCADVIEKFARHRLLERSTAYGRWGSEPELGTKLLLGARASQPAESQSPPPPPATGLKSRLRRAFRTNSSGSGGNQYSLVTQLTTAALCASTPVLPAAPNVPPVVKSLIRPLTVPKVQVTLAGAAAASVPAVLDADPLDAPSCRPPTAKPTAASIRQRKKK